MSRPTIPPESATFFTRRAWLAGAMAGLGTTAIASSRLVEFPQQVDDRPRAVIWLMLVGGPSAQETFNPKPEARSSRRGPFEAISTALPGIRIVEHLPEIARRLDRMTLVRTLYHDGAPVHETGFQRLHAGRALAVESDHDHPGLRLERDDSNGYHDRRLQLAALIGPSITKTGLTLPRGLLEGSLDRLEVRTRLPLDDPDRLADRALAAIAQGRRFIQVNTAGSVFDPSSWDAHGHRPFSTFDEYRDRLLPRLDRSVAALVDRLDRDEVEANTLLIVSGEMGRHPRINRQGGRDHWQHAWSGLLYGGSVTRGLVIGQTDDDGAYPIEQPFPAEWLYQLAVSHLGLSRDGM